MNKLMSKMLKAGSVSGAASMADSQFFNAKNLVTTPLPILNIAFSGEVDGGFSPGITVVVGESKTFKSLLSLYCLKAYLDKYDDGIGILFDTEYGITPEYIKSFGIDPNRVLHVPVEHIEELKFDFVKKLEGIEKGDHVFFLVDSIGQISSKKEVDDTAEEKSTTDMTRAKSMRSLLRLITVQLTKKELPCILINHCYVEIGPMYPKTIIPGGCVLEGTKIMLADATFKNVEDFVVGDTVTTMDGPRLVTDVWNPDTLFNGTPECYEIEFEDGSKVTCSDSHKFIVDGEWTHAEDLTIGQEVVLLS